MQSKIEYKNISGFNHRIKLIDRSRQNTPTIVFLHEGLGCIEFWRDFPEEICGESGCGGMVYDRRGYGRSDPLKVPWPFDYLNDEALFLNGILNAYDIRKTILAGHSDGATIALLAAAAGDPRITGVITEAAHIFVEDITIEGVKAFIRTYHRKNMKEKLKNYHADQAETVFFRWADRWLSDEFRNWNIENRLPGIKCPLLAIQGDSDEYGTEKQVQGVVNGVSGPARYAIIAKCGHIPHHQNRPETARTMIAFIEEIISCLPP